MIGSNVAAWASKSALGSELFGAAVVGSLGWLGGALFEGPQGNGNSVKKDALGGFVGGLVGIIGGFAYSSYTKFELYIFGSSVLCAAMGLGLVYHLGERERETAISNGKNPDEEVSILWPAGVAGTIGLVIGTAVGTVVQTSASYIG